MNQVLNMKHNSPTFRLVTKPLRHANTQQDGYGKRSRFSAAGLIGSLLGLATLALFSLDASAAGDCSQYMGNATLNEYAHQQNFVEVRKLNTSQSFANWKVRVYTSVPANTTTCGSGCAELALPASGADLCGNYQVLTFGRLATTANAVLLDGDNDVVDILRLTTAGSVTSIYPKPSCSGYVGPSTDLVNVDNSKKGIDRLPDGYGAWRNTPGTGDNSIVSKCGSNTPNSTTSANLGLTKSVTSGASITVGQTATFLLTVTNAGPDTATNLQIRDTLPSGLSYLSNTAPTAGTFNSSTMIWDVPLLTNGQSSTLNLTVTGTSGGSQINSAVAASDNTDSNLANNTATATVTVASNVNHYELTVPASSVTCLASTVKVTACTAAATASPCTSKATTISGQTATLATNAGTLGTTTVTFNASGDATTTLSHAAAANLATATVTLSGETTGASAARRCCNGSTCAPANSCTTTFNTAGFIVANAVGGSAYTVPTQTAGTTSTSSTGNLILRAVKTNLTTQACESALVGTTTVNWSAQCNNPTTCSTGSLMSLSGASSTSAGSSPIAGNANGSTASSTPVSMTFDANGNAPFSFNYADVGQVTLFASKATSGTLLTPLSGSSNAFVVRPGGFAVTGIQQTASPFLVNPAATSASPARFVKAGESFSATVKATTSTGEPAPNYGRETTPEGLLLTRALVAPVGGATGTLANATIAGGTFISGVATVTNLSWSEVGIISLTPSVADADYLGAGTVTGTAAPNVGRFIPDHFDTAVTQSAGGAPMACPTGLACPTLYNGFAYSGQAFTVDVYAKNAGGELTTNYGGAAGSNGFSRAVTLNAVGSVGGAAIGATAPGGVVTAATSAVPVGSFKSGSTATGTPAAPIFLFAVTPTVPTLVYVRAAESSGGDSVSSLRAVAANSVEGGTMVVSGRVKIPNGYGSELLPLEMPAVVQYFTASGWKDSTTDSVSTLTLPSSFALTPSGTTTVSLTSVKAASGKFTVGLAKPTGLTAGVKSNANILPAGPSYLMSGSNADGVDPTVPGLATFGIYKSPLIYRRENY
jgi:uncharacterized repeat protein (TIGR01451 family)